MLRNVCRLFQDAGGPPSLSRLLGREGRPAQLPCCRQPFPKSRYVKVARDPGTIFGHKLIAPVVPAGASLGVAADEQP